MNRHFVFHFCQWGNWQSSTLLLFSIYRQGGNERPFLENWFGWLRSYAGEVWSGSSKLLQVIRKMTSRCYFSPFWMQGSLNDFSAWLDAATNSVNGLVLTGTIIPELCEMMTCLTAQNAVIDRSDNWDIFSVVRTMVIAQTAGVHADKIANGPEYTGTINPCLRYISFISRSVYNVPMTIGSNGLSTTPNLTRTCKFSKKQK